MARAARQSSLTIAAAIDASQIGPARALLSGMNRQPGCADPDNALVPFGAFEQLHFARIIILDDTSLGDLAQYGTSFADAPIWLVLMADCDGTVPTMIDALAERAGPGLRQIFGLCRDPPGTDMRAWLRAHALPAVATYVNWVGRTVADVRAEIALHDALRTLPPVPGVVSASETRARMVAVIRRHGDAPPVLPGRPWIDLLLEIGGVVLGFCGLVLILPLLILVAVPFLIVLRQREQTDAVIAPRPDAAHVASLAVREDRDVSNQFSAFGSVKPGAFRLGTLIVVLWATNLGMALLFRRGRLARVGTIHFARWVFFDDRRRLLFASSYDGSLDSYMDDFINKVAFALNLIFSNGIGYPRCRFLVLDGARDEQTFKDYIRRHQLPTYVWYKAYPGLTAAALSQNRRLREGFEQGRMSETEARRWLSLI